MRARGPDLASRVASLGEAIETATGRVPEVDLAPVRDVLTRTTERAAFSAEHTVVALAGATGAGKSSVFNALAGAELARTSRQRPTTSLALAAIAESPGLAAGSAELLEWLGVPTRHELAVSATHPDGLVLLDLPDHDSVVTEHRLRADHVTERADLLVWVTNPQKYADSVLHDDYLRPLASHQGTVVVVLNQIDRLGAAEAAACLADLERLVRADGLRAHVVATSALTGAGIGELQALVAEAAQRRAAATARLVAEVAGAGNRLLELTEPATGAARSATSKARATLLETLEAGAGVPLVVEAVRGSALRDAVAVTGWPPTRWTQRFRADPLRTLGLRPSLGLTKGKAASASPDPGAEELRRTSLPTASPALRSQVATAARAYVAAAAGELPGPWGEAVHARVVGRAQTITDALDVAIAGTSQDLVRPARWWRAVGTLQWLLVTLAAAGLLWLAVLAVMAYLQLPALPTPELALGELVTPWPTVLALGGAAAGIVVAVIARLAARAGAARRARSAYGRLHRRVELVAAERLTGEVDAELAALATLRAAASRASA